MADESKGTDTPRWREDFPIRWDADNYLTRRELAKFLTLGSALLVGASAAIAGVGALRSTGEFPEIWIAASDAIGSGQSILFRYPTDEDPCIAVRTADGALKAYSQVCTHLSCAVRHEPGSSELFCPCHRGFFSVADGRPLAGPPTRALPRITLAERDGGIYAVGVEV